MNTQNLIRNDWKALNSMWNELSEVYYNFKQSYIKELRDNFNIDCGTDFANYIVNIGNIKY